MIEKQPLALYIHWPFCVSKCPYCDFNSHVRTVRPEADWRDALLVELAREAALTPGRTLGSIFFGGGTPSLMDPVTVGAVIERATSLWSVRDDIEITLEANPSSVEAARFAGFAKAGVNRVSLGLQALNDADLKGLGRAHDVAEGLAALDIAQANFARVSTDLIYAREGQTLAAWRAELERALAFGTDHLSLYQLTIEPGTHFATRHRRGDLVLPVDDLAADMFLLTQEMTAAAGRPAYETSNHAAPGAESRHNLTYWRYGDYVGVGPGAHGRRNGAATVRARLPERWLGLVRDAGDGIESETPLDLEERATEALMMGLRLSEGVSAEDFELATGVTLANSLDVEEAARLRAQGFVTWNGDRLAVAPKGRLLLDAILPRLIDVRLPQADGPALSKKEDAISAELA
ncbi:MAG: radical SAM family heme chaperone HemW [Pacificimonas sp.]